tara:strand:- start:959 stop:1558 length:600 start_codon:yes stop_codon:yes gene_type:complete
MISDFRYWFFANAIPSGVCDEIVKLGLTGTKNRATVESDGIKKGEVQNSKIRNSDVVWIKDEWLTKLVQSYVQTANQSADWRFDFNQPEHAQFTIYDKNQHYDWHQDLSYNKYLKGMNPDTQRKLSATVQLTDESKYKGGELLFKDLKGKNEPEILTNKVFKKKGTIVVFPSYMLHKVTPVTQGIRHSLVMWFRGPSFK